MNYILASPTGSALKSSPPGASDQYLISTGIFFFSSSCPGYLSCHGRGCWTALRYYATRWAALAAHYILNLYTLVRALYVLIKSTSQQALCSNSLATLLNSNQHQPECIPYTTVYRGVWSTVSQIKNSKLCRLRQNSDGKLKAIKELYIGWKLSVHAMCQVCVHEIYLAMRYP